MPGMQQSLGETVVWSLGPLKRSDGTIATDLTDADVFTWQIWPGDDQTTLASGAGTLRAAAENETPGFYVDATIGTSVIGGLAASIYRIVCIKNPGTDDTIVYDEPIRFTPFPGSAAALKTYCSFSDLTDRQSWVESLQDTATTQAGFAEQRHRARQWLDSCILARVKRDLETQRSRHGAVLYADPIVPTDGYDLGPTWGPSILPDTTMRDQIATIRGYLDADKLIVGDDDDGQAADITAWYALYVIASPQAAGASTDKDWSGWAATCRRNAIRACASWTARIDTDDDGVADFEIQP